MRRYLVAYAFTSQGTGSGVSRSFLNGYDDPTRLIDQNTILQWEADIRNEWRALGMIILARVTNFQEIW